MKINADTPQRLAVVVEQNKAGNWSVGAYLVTADGRRERRGLAIRDSYDDAASLLKEIWQDINVLDNGRKSAA